jgi:hypothetical protein
MPDASPANAADQPHARCRRTKGFTYEWHEEKEIGGYLGRCLDSRTLGKNRGQVRAIVRLDSRI